MRTASWIWVLALAGCSVETDVDLASLTIVSPAPGAVFTRDQLGSSGALVAPVGVEVEVSGPIARVAIRAGDVELGDLGGGSFAAELATSGPLTLTATALDANGIELLATSVDITVEDPAAADCRDWLDLYRLDYAAGPDKPGVADPVTVTLPLNGITYRYSGNTSPRETLFGDCALMRSLAEAAPIVRAHGVHELVDIGIYNYRCIDQSKTPPDCAMSQHAYARAIDIAQLVTGDGDYSVVDDWVIDPDDDTCTATTEGDKDAWLHQVICELKAAGVWNIVLTPNYNGDHRNHFHVDLTEDADFIERTVGGGPPADF